MIDPVVEEVRKARDGHARRFDYDLAKICEDIRNHQRHCGHPVVRLRKKQKSSNSGSKSQ